MTPTLLDGPLGTELSARGIETKLPLWSASALRHAPETVRRIHQDYALAGATVHTTNTFRTKRRTVGAEWETLTRKAVRLTREAVGSGRVAGCVSPLADCYRPDLSPTDPRPEHREMVEVLANAGCDLLLCETFPLASEALVAVDESVRTGLETWVAFTAGPEADLMTPDEMSEAARRAVNTGARAVLVNCVPATRTLPFVRALERARLKVPIGAYANAGAADEQMGWTASPQPGAALYAEHARKWVDAGATILGGCCGTRPEHIAALAECFGQS